MLNIEKALKSGLTKENVLNELKNYGFADVDKSKITPKDAIKALETISKMLGFDEPTNNNLEEEKQKNFLKAVENAVSNTSAEE